MQLKQEQKYIVETEPPILVVFDLAMNLGR